MEWALAIAGCRNLHLIEEPWADEVRLDSEIPGVVREYGGHLFKRLYFGQEFCERAVPGAGDIAMALARSKKRKLDFTLVTPYVTERGLEKLEELLKELVRLAPRCEVVVNDWGVMHLIRRRFPALRPVAGRLLNKAWRDPRLMSRLNKDSGGGALGHYKGFGLAGPHTASLLNLLRVKRIEIDNLPQGMEPILPGSGLAVSMYLPYGFITTGRICLLGSWGLDKQSKFRTYGKYCSRRCASHSLEMSGICDYASGDGEGLSIVQRGNTVFYRQKAGLLDRGLSRAAALGVDRIVFQPDPL